MNKESPIIKNIFNDVKNTFWKQNSAIYRNLGQIGDYETLGQVPL